MAATNQSHDHIKIEYPARSSPRLAQRQERTTNRVTGSTSFTPSTDSVPSRKVEAQTIQVIPVPSRSHCKRECDAGPSNQDPDSSPSKRLRSSPLVYKIEVEPRNVEVTSAEDPSIPIESWTGNGRWHHHQEDLVDRDIRPEEQDNGLPGPLIRYVEVNGAEFPPPVPEVPTPWHQGASRKSSIGPGNRARGDGKNAPYHDARYPVLLEGKGSYMHDFDIDRIPKSVLEVSRILLETDQIVPFISLFRDKFFTKTCQKMQDRNDAMIIQDVARLIVPSAQNFGIYGAVHLEHVAETVNERWTSSVPVQGPWPQPDYSVGFGRSAFTRQQLDRLDALTGTVNGVSMFKATDRMYFPFLTCEVQGGRMSLDIADRQNAHSMTSAVRAVVELFRAAKREEQIHGKILAFSVSHDYCSVRIYGHYPIIEGSSTRIYRHTIHKFDFTALNGRDKWTAYKFTKTVYDWWMPGHIERIRSVIDQLLLAPTVGLGQGYQPQNAEASSPPNGLPHGYYGLKSYFDDEIEAAATYSPHLIPEPSASKKRQRSES
nr:hypothetical protein CFP56_76456 [Quercus suber]